MPIAGIVGVTNPAPTAISAQDETDAELRTRAKNFLHGSERATLGALKQAVARQQITADVDEVVEPTDVASGASDHAARRGCSPPDLQQRLLTRDRGRSAGRRAS